MENREEKPRKTGKGGVPVPVNPNGRPKGVPNKATVEFKQAVVNLLEFAAPKMVEWLDEIAQDDPSRALDHVGRLAEYAYPKLSRGEVTGANGGAIEINHKSDDELIARFMGKP